MLEVMEQQSLAEGQVIPRKITDSNQTCFFVSAGRLIDNSDIIYHN